MIAKKGVGLEGQSAEDMSKAICLNGLTWGKELASCVCSMVARITGGKVLAGESGCTSIPGRKTRTHTLTVAPFRSESEYLKIASEYLRIDLTLTSCT